MQSLAVPETAEISSSPDHGDSSSAVLRSVALLVQDNQDHEALRMAARLLRERTDDADRQALRSIALWLMSHPLAAKALRRSLDTPQTL